MKYIMSAQVRRRAKRVNRRIYYEARRYGEEQSAVPVFSENSGERMGTKTRVDKRQDTRQER